LRNEPNSILCFQQKLKTKANFHLAEAGYRKPCLKAIRVNRRLKNPLYPIQNKPFPRNWLCSYKKQTIAGRQQADS
jgi:hypothetical protein